MSDERVSPGDTFLRITRSDYYVGGEVCVVKPVRQRRFDGGSEAVLGAANGARLIGPAWESIVLDANLLHSGDWRRVPPGYTVPSVADLLAGVERLVEAYRAMLRDPETGAAGVDATVRQMAALAGIEVET